MKSVLISIQPKWCELIASGKKTVEVRKTKPKLETPFKVYIYETKALYKPNGCNHLFEGKGKVIGEFVCSNIAKGNSQLGSCLTMREISEYANGKEIYGWHISNLVIYDKPRELSEFRIKCKGGCDIPYLYSPPCENCRKDRLTRPFQSWGYVYEADT